MWVFGCRMTNPSFRLRSMTGFVILQILRYANMRSLLIKQIPKAIQLEILRAKKEAIERSRNGRNPKSDPTRNPKAKKEAIERSRNGRNGPSLISVQMLYRIVKDKTKPKRQHRVEQYKRRILCADTCYYCTSKQ